MTTDPRPIDVAVGVIRDAAGRVLINQRPSGKPFAGQWEFPGGKIDAGETRTDALARELHEELGIRILEQRPLITLSHRYDALAVRLHVMEVLTRDGEPRGREDQPLQWVAPAELDRIDLLAANAAIVRAVRLPRVCLITDTPRFGTERTLERLARHAASERVLVIVREKQLPRAGLAAFVAAVRELCRAHRSLVCVHADCDFDDYDKVDGVHYPARALDQGAQGKRPGLTGISCHSAAELQLAHERAADYALLSPVHRTDSHPEAEPLGWRRFKTLCDAAPLPVFALGGMQPGDFDPAIHHGAQGIAMLGAAWR